MALAISSINAHCTIAVHVQIHGRRLDVRGLSRNTNGCNALATSGGGFVSAIGSHFEFLNRYEMRTVGYCGRMRAFHGLLRASVRVKIVEGGTKKQEKDKYPPLRVHAQYQQIRLNNILFKM